MDNSNKQDTWLEWSRYVLETLKSINTRLNDLDGKVDDKVDMLKEQTNSLEISITRMQAELEIKARNNGARWGIIAAIAVNVISGIILYIATNV